jgi:hypothetical protein
MFPMEFVYPLEEIRLIMMVILGSQPSMAICFYCKSRQAYFISP